MAARSGRGVWKLVRRREVVREEKEDVEVGTATAVMKAMVR